MIGHYLTMVVISLMSGILSGMWVWADKPSDIRLSINDIYMATLMTALMIFLMAVLDRDYNWAIGSVIAGGLVLWLIRNQLFVSKTQYFQGMIPHHSMAIMTSRHLLRNQGANMSPNERTFVEQIISTQEREIAWMKSHLEI